MSIIDRARRALKGRETYVNERFAGAPVNRIEELRKLGEFRKIKSSKISEVYCVDDRTAQEPAMRVPGGHLGDILVVLAVFPELGVEYVAKKIQEWTKHKKLYAHGHYTKADPLEKCGHIQAAINQPNEYGLTEELGAQLQSLMSGSVDFNIDDNIHGPHTGQKVVIVHTERRPDGSSTTYHPHNVGTAYVYTDSLEREFQLARLFAADDDEAEVIAEQFRSMRNYQAVQTLIALGINPDDNEVVINVNVNVNVNEKSEPV